MPFFSIIIPQIPADSKDDFLAAWPTVAAAMKAQPTVLGVSAGPIVAADGQAVTDFQFLQCLGMFVRTPVPKLESEPSQHSQLWTTKPPSSPVISSKVTSKNTKQKLPVPPSQPFLKSLISQPIQSPRNTHSSRVSR